jgi:AraC-like DNA-binding protein
MKPIVQKLPLLESTSFVARTYKTPNFEVGWHQHVEYELILFTEGSGLSFVGNHVGEFETGDVYFLGSNLPHTFQKTNPDLVTSAIVVQFHTDLLGPVLFELPESRLVSKLLARSRFGLKANAEAKSALAAVIKELETAVGFRRLILLLSCLQELSTPNAVKSVSTQEPRAVNLKDQLCIDRVFQFTIDNFKERISLSQVAGIACMTVSSFCTYFKRSTKKTYVDFLNEVRIGYACNLLMESNTPVLQVSYESGYNTMANFHKQFLKVKGVTPLQYRKYFS